MCGKSLASPWWAALPSGNQVIMLLMAGTFAAQMLLDPGATRMSVLVLTRCSVLGLLGYMWLHMGMVHLVENLLTLWIFGRCVYPRLGGVLYAFAYVVTGVAAGFVHMMYDGRPIIGASGAIMGVLAMHVVICFRQFGGLGPWLILMWFLATLGAGIVGDFPGAYMAHIGGFLSGMVLAFLLVVFRAVECDRMDHAFVCLEMNGTPVRMDRRPD